MRIALVETTPKPKVYPISLLKIGSSLKDIGHTCFLFRNSLPGRDEFDEIWINTIFTFDAPHSLGMAIEAKKRAGRVVVGGIAATLLPDYYSAHGVDVHVGLLEHAEQCAPDYSLLGEAPKYSIAYLSRGCVRKCKFCMVPVLEPDFRSVSGWRDWVHPSTKHIHFFDNNWLAKPAADLMRDIDDLHDAVSSGLISQIDFEQGLDARLVTRELAARLEGLPIRPVRFAFDGMHEDGHVQTAVTTMSEHGFSDFRNYVLYNFTDTPRDFYYRMREHVKLSEELGVSCSSFPARYQPIMEIDVARSYVGVHWTPTERAGFMRILNKSYISGLISAKTTDEFVYWFGADADEFVRLLNYPHIEKLCKIRKARLRAK